MKKENPVQAGCVKLSHPGTTRLLKIAEEFEAAHKEFSGKVFNEDTVTITDAVERISRVSVRIILHLCSSVQRYPRCFR
jgi:hypothetical protein